MPLSNRQTGWFMALASCAPEEEAPAEDTCATTDDCDGDGVTSLQDCDDHNALVPSDTVVQGDGVDNDCDGIGDNLRRGRISAVEADFVVQSSFLGMFPDASEVGDYNGDGVLDLAIESFSHGCYVLEGPLNVSRTVGLEDTVPFPCVNGFREPAEVTGDGLTDLVGVDWSGYVTYVWPGPLGPETTWSGTFTGADYKFFNKGFGDANGDGIDDLVGTLLSSGSEEVSIVHAPFVGDVVGVPDADIILLEDAFAGATSLEQASLADVTADGLGDLLLTVQDEYGRVALFGGLWGWVAVGPFTGRALVEDLDAWTLSPNPGCTDNANVQPVAGGDLDGDGDDDLVGLAPTGDYAPNGSFSEDGHVLNVVPAPVSALSAPMASLKLGGSFTFPGSAGDVDGDGFDDLMVQGNAFDSSCDPVNSYPLTCVSVIYGPTLGELDVDDQGFTLYENLRIAPSVTGGNWDGEGPDDIIVFTDFDEYDYQYDELWSISVFSGRLEAF